MEKTKNMGIEVKNPEKACNDRKCPFHGDLKVRGRQFVGRVKSAFGKHSAIVSWERKEKMPKYERYETRRTKIHVHNPECINAQKDDIVRIAECRPLSKTKKFVIIEKIGKVEEVVGEEDSKPEEKEKKEESKAKKDSKASKPGNNEKKQGKGDK